MSDTVGIKIPKGTPIAKCVQIVRKIEPSLSISDINSRINNDEYVLSYDYTDDDGIKNIIKCYEQLAKLGIKPRVFELDDEECDIEIIKNLDNMYDEISDEIDAEIEAEDEDD
ncbi:MAG: hypothetical protein J5685_09575 [Clostridiales bacterium]|nr:hypothetical protein [Clostridiales bacterium]